MSGLELTRALKRDKDTREVPVIMHSFCLVSLKSVLPLIQRLLRCGVVLPASALLLSLAR